MLQKIKDIFKPKEYFIDFMGIGAQKAGTTWLHHWLSKHPDIQFPDKKELHYWDIHPKGNIKEYKKLFHEKKRLLQGEITPAYSILEVDTIRRIFKHLPELKLVSILRNPIDRAWSAAKMIAKRSELDASQINDEYFIGRFQSPASLLRGDYERTLRNWSAVYPKEQIMVAFYEEVASQPRSLLQKICRFLGVSDGFVNTIPESELNKKMASCSEHKAPENLSQVLQEIYFPKIRSLQDYLQKDLSKWLG